MGTLEVRRVLVREPIHPGADLIFHQAPHPTQLAQAVEVAGHGHVRVRRLVRSSLGIVAALRRSQHRHVDPEQDALHRTSGGGDPHVQPARVLVIDPGEVRLSVIDPGGREHREAGAPVQRAHLLAGAADGGRGGDHLGLAGRAVRPRAAAQRLDGGLIEPDHGAQRPGDQVQLVLHNQIRRGQPRQLQGPLGERVGVRGADEAVPLAAPDLTGPRAHSRPRSIWPSWKRSRGGSNQRDYPRITCSRGHRRCWGLKGHRTVVCDSLPLPVREPLLFTLKELSDQALLRQELHPLVLVEGDREPAEAIERDRPLLRDLEARGPARLEPGVLSPQSLNFIKHPR